MNVLIDHFDHYVNWAEVVIKVLKNVKTSNTVDYERTTFVKFTNEREISELFRGLKNKKVCGHDGIGNETFFCCSPITDFFLARGFNDGIKSCTFPKRFKTAKVTHL